MPRRLLLPFCLAALVTTVAQAQVKTVAEYVDQVTAISNRADLKSANDYIDRNHAELLREWIAITEINAPSGHEQERCPKPSIASWVSIHRSAMPARTTETSPYSPASRQFQPAPALVMARTASLRIARSSRSIKEPRKLFYWKLRWQEFSKLKANEPELPVRAQANQQLSRDTNTRDIHPRNRSQTPDGSSAGTGSDRRNANCSPSSRCGIR
jgi:hypothetical protein